MRLELLSLDKGIGLGLGPIDTTVQKPSLLTQITDVVNKGVTVLNQVTTTVDQVKQTLSPTNTTSSPTAPAQTVVRITNEPTEKKEDNTMLYLGIGSAVVLTTIIATVVISKKKKKSTGMGRIRSRKATRRKRR